MKLSMILTFALPIVLSTTLQASEPEVTTPYVDQRSERVTERLQLRSDNAGERGNERRSERLQNKTDRVDGRYDRLGERITEKRTSGVDATRPSQDHAWRDQRSDLKGQRINQRLDKASNRAEYRGRDGLAGRLDRQGNRTERRLDRRFQ